VREKPTKNQTDATKNKRNWMEGQQKKSNGWKFIWQKLQHMSEDK
jgi:hypothetical protein